MRTQHTLVEVLVIGGVFLLFVSWIACPLLVTDHDLGKGRRRACANNCAEMIKACHLYADTVTNLGQFPLFAESHSSHGQEALAKLFDAYVKDHRVFSCPSKCTDTSGLKRYLAPGETTLQTGFTNYGYDPGHKPTDGTAGIVGDMGLLHATNGNSTNHGSDGSGQNVALGSGTVEWWDDARAHATVTKSGQAITDRIFQDDISADFPEELETWIVR